MYERNHNYLHELRGLFKSQYPCMMPSLNPSHIWESDIKWLFLNLIETGLTFLALIVLQTLTVAPKALLVKHDVWD